MTWPRRRSQRGGVRADTTSTDTPSGSSPRHRPDDALLTPEEIAAGSGSAEQWLADARCRGFFGPPYEKLGPLTIRYMPRKAKVWLNERTHTSTAEYDNARAQKAALASKAARAAR